MGYKVTFENGQSVVFDTQPSAADIEEAHAHVKTLPSKAQAPIQTNALVAGGKTALESVVPTATGLAGGIAAMTAGAPLIAGASSIPGIGLAAGPATALALGLGGAYGGGEIGNMAQNAAGNLIPESVKEKIGFGKAQRAAETEQNPYASFVGGLVPSLAAFRPGAVPDIVTKGGKLISGNTQRVGMGALGGGIEAGSELLHGEPLDPKKIALAAAFQGVATTPTRLGNRILEKFDLTPAVKKSPTSTILDKMNSEQTQRDAGVTAKTEEDLSFWKDRAAQMEQDAINGPAAKTVGEVFGDRPITLGANGVEIPGLRSAADAMSSFDRQVAREERRTGRQGATESTDTLFVTPEGEALFNPLFEDQQRLNMVKGVADEQQRLAAESAMAQRSQQGQQGDVFEPQTNMHRPYEEVFAQENGKVRPLSKAEFTETLNNLAKEPGTAFQMPEDINAAYKQYLEHPAHGQMDFFGANEVPVVPTHKTLGEMTPAEKAKFTKSGKKLGISDDMQGRMAAQENDLRSATNALLDALQMHGGSPGFMERPDVGKALMDFARALFDAMGGSVQKAIQRAQELLGRVWESVKDSLKPLLSKFAAEPLTGETIPKNMESESIIAAATAEPGKGNFIKMLQSGATLTAMKLKSALIREGGRVIQNAGKRSDLGIRNMVFPYERSINRLSKQEAIDLAAIFKDEALNNRAFDIDILEKNLSRKQLDAYARKREMDEASLAAVNAERKRQNKPPVDEKEYYLSSRWQGPFRQIMRDDKGRPVWYLAAESKKALDKQIAALQKEVPGLSTGPEDFIKSAPEGYRSDLQSAYSLMLDTLGRDDPAVKMMRERYEELAALNAENAFGQTKHFEEKHNIRGFIGDRPGMDPHQEALAMFRSSADYAKASFRWSALQTAGDTLKPVFSNPELLASQPDQLAYLREYFNSALGQGQASVFKSLEKSFQDATGHSSKAINETVNRMKSFFILQKMGLNMGTTIAQTLQLGSVLPHLTNLATEGLVGNPVLAVAKGVPAGMAMASNHYLNKININMMAPMIEDAFYKRMFKYAEENGVTTRAIYDEAGVKESGQNLVTKGADTVSAGLGAIDAYTRGVAFSVFAEYLRSTNAYKNDIALFQKAEELTDVAMGDYRGSEKPMIFAKMGTTGNFLNTLQTYPMNFYNQWNMWWREAKAGNIAPLLVALGMQYLLSGAQGIPYAETTIDVMNWIKDNALPTTEWAELQKYPFVRDPKMWMVDTLGRDAIYGALSEASGVSLTAKLSAPNINEMVDAPAGVLADLAKQGYNVGRAVAYHDKPEYAAQAAMSVLPVGLAGLYETSDAAKFLTYEPRGANQAAYKQSDLSQGQVVFERTPEEIEMRKWGLRSQREARERDLTYQARTQKQVLDQKAGELVKEAATAMAKGRTKEFAEINQLYTRLKGSPIEMDQLYTIELNRKLTDKQRFFMQSKDPRSMIEAMKLSNRLKEAQ
ncbi:hypothetical protein UFOVP128_32 [uncultured Caudovirales phage]|uniref:Large polyvalent protein associated domain-containing protein n=1 Tax=uncultured Caudovirales phage TaxID=2100421 RepID=A0A6J7X436_9CAUD|nr:hypothetical protein UFOVP128_32 [uncultured Caudovirales phage]CAB5222043.1 hypothetical protein UFOVP243_12 [uncultured Caudovirales phage]